MEPEREILINDRRYTVEEWIAEEQRRGTKLEYHDGYLLDVRALNEQGLPAPSAAQTAHRLAVREAVRRNLWQWIETVAAAAAAQRCTQTATGAEFTSPDGEVVAVVDVDDGSGSSGLNDRRVRFLREDSPVRDYAYVSIHDHSVTQYSRSSDGATQVRFLTGLGDVLALPNLGPDLTLSKLYADVGLLDWTDLYQRR